MRALSVDLGGTHAAAALVDDCAIMSTLNVELPENRSLAPVLPQLSIAIRKLFGSHSPEEQGISDFVLGFPGIVDTRTNRVAAINAKYEGAIGFDFPAWAQREFGLQLRLENDARLALLGECYAGAAKGKTDVVMFTLGTGIGGVAMMDGRPLHGKHGQAGLLGGHVPIIFNGRVCTCGAIGCAEAEAAGWSLPQVCHEWPGFSASAMASMEINFKNLFAAGAAGDAVALAIRDRCLHIWSATAVAAIHAFDPELVLLGGGVMENGEVILPYVQDYVSRHAWTPWGKVRVAKAQLGSKAALLGAVPLLQDRTSIETSQDIKNVR
jgi:glucokinase